MGEDCLALAEPYEAALINQEVFFPLARELYRRDRIPLDREPEPRSLHLIDKNSAIETRVDDGDERVGKAGRFNSDQWPFPIVDRAFKVIWLQRQELRCMCSSSERPCRTFQ